MENRIKCRVLRMIKFIRGLFRLRSTGLGELPQGLSDEQKLKLLEEKISISSSGFVDKVSYFGLLPLMRSYILRIRYICALWLLRDAAIITYLSQNYEKIPLGTLSRLFCRPVLSLKIVKLETKLAGKLFNLGYTKINSVRVLTGNK